MSELERCPTCDSPIARKAAAPPSPSVPVESREQPRDLHALFAAQVEADRAAKPVLNFGCGHRFTSCPACQENATIRELRAEAEQQRRYIAQVHSSNRTMTALNDELAAERDGARDLAAHLASALNVALAYAEGVLPPQMSTRDEELAGCHVALDEAIRTFYPSATCPPALAAHLEAEQAEED